MEEFINVCEQKSVATSSDLNLLKNHRYGNKCFLLDYQTIKIKFHDSPHLCTNPFIIYGNRCYLVLCPRISHFYHPPCLAFPFPFWARRVWGIGAGGRMEGRVWADPFSPLSLWDSTAGLGRSCPTPPVWHCTAGLCTFTPSRLFCPWLDHVD